MTAGADPERTDHDRTDLDRTVLWRRLRRAVAAHPDPLATPLVVVDLDAFDANAADLERRAAGTPLRVASKSVRVPDLLRRVLARPGFDGVLAYTLAEALWLVEHDVSDDVVVAYPNVDQGALVRLLASPTARASVTLMVDCVEHLDVVDAARAHPTSLSSPASPASPVRVAIDVDAGLRLAGGRVTVGPRRSPLHSADDVLALARVVQDRPGFTLVGAMTYEGQVAGVPDEVPGRRARSAVVRRLKAGSLDQLGERRRSVAAALAGVCELEFFNAGGSGDVAEAAADPVVTEVAAGSGLLCPTLFDHYRSFRSRPAAYYGLPVTRRPAPGVVTVHGGGLVASGATGSDRAPTPWAPAGLSLTGLEGAGEVQTPLTGPPAAYLQIGELVWFRHAKAGELMEHVSSVRLLSGPDLVAEASTYRGHGLAG